jgi:hypothetical protein
MLIRQGRDQHGWSQQELATFLRVTQSSVSGWESGGAVPWDRMRELVGLFMWSPDQLVEALGWYEPGGGFPPLPDTVRGTYAEQTLTALRTGSTDEQGAGSLAAGSLAADLRDSLGPTIGDAVVAALARHGVIGRKDS